MLSTSEPFVVHCHIPRTGGMAVNQRLLVPRYGADRVQQLYNGPFARFARLPLRHRAPAMRAYAAAGHVPFGYVDALYPAAVYVSVFRDPVSRFLADLNHALCAPRNMLRARLGPDRVQLASADPDRFVAAVLCDPGLGVLCTNLQTRLAAGTARIGRYAIDAAHLTAAKTHLANPRYLIGLMSGMDQFLDRLDAALPGFGPGPIPADPARAQNQPSPVLTSAGLTARTLAAIEDANALDMVVYETAARCLAQAGDLASCGRAVAGYQAGTTGDTRPAMACRAETAYALSSGSAMSAARAIQQSHWSAQSSIHRPD